MTQDEVLGTLNHSSKGPPRTAVLGYSQPSLAGLVLTLMPTQDSVLGYSQPSLRD